MTDTTPTTEASNVSNSSRKKKRKKRKRNNNNQGGDADGTTAADGSTDYSVDGPPNGVDPMMNEDETRSRLGKSEKKARKAIQKLGMKLQRGFNRVTIKKQKNILFVISKPDVFRAPNSDTYVIFGNANIEDLNAQPRDFLSGDKWNAAKAATAMGGGLGGGAGGSGMATIEEDDGDEDETTIDESGLDPSDISMVVEQANVSRGKAVKALRANDGDIVQAIMELTM